MTYLKDLYLLVLILYLWQPISSQSIINTRREKWDFNISSGYYSGGPSNALNHFLHTLGYNWYLRTKKYLPYKFEINRSISNNIIAGVSLYFINQSLIWEQGGWENSKFKTTLLSPFLGYNFNDFFIVNIGPSMSRISYYHPTGTSLINNETHLRVGFNLKSTLKIPRRTKVFFQFEVLYSFSGTISPYYSIEIPGHQYHFTTLHATNLPVNYFYVGTGIGFRLFKKD